MKSLQLRKVLLLLVTLLLIAVPLLAQTTNVDVDDDADDAEGLAACGVCAGLGLLPLIGLAISVGIAYWIYKDAKRRGDPNAVLWAVVGFFFNLLGLIIYLVVRSKGPTAPPAGPM